MINDSGSLSLQRRKNWNSKLSIIFNQRTKNKGEEWDRIRQREFFIKAICPGWYDTMEECGSALKVLFARLKSRRVLCTPQKIVLRLCGMHTMVFIKHIIFSIHKFKRTFYALWSMHFKEEVLEEEIFCCLQH